ncbi:MerR family transcriptional regulator [Gordonia sp. (in: high G+C Gram-positive bacteria)]
MTADDAEFACAVGQIDRRLCAEIDERQQHRRRIAALAAGDNLALPTEAAAYLGRLRALGFTDSFVRGERDAWILMAAQLPDRIPLYMAVKQRQLDDPDSLALYRDIAAAVEWDRADPRLPAIVDRLVAMIEAAETEKTTEILRLPDDLAELLDAMFRELVPIAARFLELLRQRGWTGCTNLERLP